MGEDGFNLMIKTQSQRLMEELESSPRLKIAAQSIVSHLSKHSNNDETFCSIDSPTKTHNKKKSEVPTEPKTVKSKSTHFNRGLTVEVHGNHT